jgi:steroid 5-alpha reductase family enzyme
MQTNLLAWFVTLICYGSLWVFIQDFLYSAERAKDWTEFFADFSVWQVLWGLGLVLSTGFYVVATLNLGLRFSNLSHRGIVTTGLYRFTKHPAYIFKNIYLWFLMCPALFEADMLDQIQGVLFLIFIHLIYILRAKTEEEHLSQDKEYRTYRAAMERKSLLRRFRF